MAALSVLPDLTRVKSGHCPDGRACLPLAGAIPRQPRQARPDNLASGPWRAPCLRACALRQSDRRNAPPERFRSVLKVPFASEKRLLRWSDILCISWPRRSYGLWFPLLRGSQTLTWLRQTSSGPWKRTVHCTLPRPRTTSARRPARRWHPGSRCQAGRCRKSSASPHRD